MKNLERTRLPTRWLPSVLTSILLIALTLLAFGLRVYGARSSIAYIPDTQIVRQALDLGQALTSDKAFDINLGDKLKYPQTLPIYLLFVYGLVFVGGYLSGLFASVTDFTTFLFTQRETIHFITIVALSTLSTAAVPLAFFAARRIEPGHTGWLAAGLVATDLILVQFSHQARPHAALASVSLIAVILLARLIKEHLKWWEPLAATVACALTIGTLQSGLLIVIPFGVVWLIRLYDARRHHTLRRTALALGLNVGLLLALAFCLYPPIFTEYTTLILDLLAPSSSKLQLGGGIHRFSENTFGTRQIVRFSTYFGGYQPLPALFFGPAFAYFLWQFRSQWRWLTVVLAFPLANLIVWSNFFAAARYWGALSLFNNILCAYFIEAVCRYLLRRNNLSLNFSRPVLFAILLFPALIQALRLDYVLAQPDTRTQASEWVKQTVTNGATVIANFQLLELTPTQTSLQRQAQDFPGSLGTYNQWLLQQSAHAYPTGPAYDILDYGLYWPESLAEQHQFAQRLQIDYVLFQTTLSSAIVDTRLYDYAQQYGQPVAVFCPGHTWSRNFLPTDIFSIAAQEIWTVDRAGPIVVIYQLAAQPIEPPKQLTCP